MILGKVIWDAETYLIIALIIGTVIICGIWTWRFCDGIEDAVDDWTESPIDNLPSETTFEILKEKPEAKPASSSVSQASSCSAPSSAPAPDNSSDSPQRPTGKGGYLPE
ncbi:MAG: hypothetical protein J1F43_02555 [Muribaculaceae bacterium]|nr:hypothetical protein [Muribaculaceae bacterium]